MKINILYASWTPLLRWLLLFVTMILLLSIKVLEIFLVKIFKHNAKTKKFQAKNQVCTIDYVDISSSWMLLDLFTVCVRSAYDQTWSYVWDRHTTKPGLMCKIGIQPNLVFVWDRHTAKPGPMCEIGIRPNLVFCVRSAYDQTWFYVWDRHTTKPGLMCEIGIRPNLVLCVRSACDQTCSYVYNLNTANLIPSKTHASDQDWWICWLSITLRVQSNLPYVHVGLPQKTAKS